MNGHWSLELSARTSIGSLQQRRTARIEHPMSKSYLPWTQDQPYLLPPSLRDWLPERHLAWFILEVVATLDLSPIAAAIEVKDPRGQRPCHPQMMVALLMYGYCTGVFSSRKLERACHEDVAFRVITANPSLTSPPSTSFAACIGRPSPSCSSRGCGFARLRAWSSSAMWPSTAPRCRPTPASTRR